MFSTHITLDEVANGRTTTQTGINSPLMWVQYSDYITGAPSLSNSNHHQVQYNHDAAVVYRWNGSSYDSNYGAADSPSSSFPLNYLENLDTSLGADQASFDVFTSGDRYRYYPQTHTSSNHLEDSNYAPGESSGPLTLYGSAKYLQVCDLGSSFSSYSPIDYPVSSTSGESFTASIAVPTAQATSVKKIVVQSSGDCTAPLAQRTMHQNISVDPGTNTSVVINASLPTDKLTANGMSGRVRSVVSVDCGTVAITSTSGVEAVNGYQTPVNQPASEIAFDGTQTSVSRALESLTYNRASCTGSELLTASIIQEGSDPNSPISYNPENGHYYQFVRSDDSWEQAFNEITGSSLTGFDGEIPSGNYNLNRSYSGCPYQFNGMCGYMATITSERENSFIGAKAGETNIWLGATDRRRLGTWKWEDDRAPEYNQTISSKDRCSIKSGLYSNWGGGEPNSYDCDGETNIYSGESALQTIHGNNPIWNNLDEYSSKRDGGDSYGVRGFIVEYGGSSVDGEQVTGPQTHLITLSLG
jgi:hypothetical protein